MLAALKMERMERAVRPCFPMTFPKSFAETLNSSTVNSSPSTDRTATCSGSSTSALAIRSTNSRMSPPCSLAMAAPPPVGFLRPNCADRSRKDAAQDHCWPHRSARGLVRTPKHRSVLRDVKGYRGIVLDSEICDGGGGVALYYQQLTAIRCLQQALTV